MRQLILLPALLSLYACTPQAEDPKAVAQQYWQAMVDGDTETAKRFITLESHQVFDTHTKTVTREPLEQVALDDQRTSVTTTLNPDTARPHMDRPFETILVLEDGRWKIDLGSTAIAPERTDLEKRLDEMADELNQSIEQSVDSADEVVEEGLKLFDEALQQGSKEMSESFQDAMRKIQEAMRRSVDQMKERREQLQEQNTPSGNGEGVI